MDKHLKTERTSGHIKKYLYDNGSPFEERELIEREINQWIIRKNQKKHVFIILDGPQSTGKTTLGIELIDIINYKHGLKPCDLTETGIQLSMGGEAFLTKLRLCHDNSMPVIAYDEAGDYNRKGWQSRLNKILERVIDTFRAYGIIAIFIVHDFTKLPAEVFDKRLPWCLIHLKERDTGGGRSEWHYIRNIYYIRHVRKKTIFPEDAFNFIHPNIKCRFKDLSPERSKLLDILSTSTKKEILDTAEIKLKGLLSIKDLSNKLNRSEPWIRAKLPKLGIKPEIKHKKIAYYSYQNFLTLEAELKR